MQCFKFTKIHSLAIVVLVLAPARNGQAGLLVSAWSLGNGVDVFVNDNLVRDYSIIASNTPAPFTAPRYNAVGNSNSAVAYSFGWMGDSANFRIDGAQTAAHPSASLVQTGSGGFVDFTPMVDSLISIHVRYNYTLPDAFMEAVGAGGVSDDVAGITYAELFVHDFSFGPTSGSFDQTMTAVVPAGCNCNFGYTMRLTTRGNLVAATDNGTVELSITPIPEPAAILPLALGAVILRRRLKR